MPATMSGSCSLPVVTQAQELPAAAVRNCFLIGVVHGDPWGLVRAGKLLHYLRPQVVTVEISRFSLAYRQRRLRHWQQQFAAAVAQLPPVRRQHLALQRLAAQIAWPFEVAAAENYARQAGVPWYPIDLNLVARRHLPLYSRELLTVANLRQLVTTPDGSWEDWCQQEYRRAARALAVESQAGWRSLPDLRPAAGRLREKLLAGRLRRLLQSGQRLVHLGGWEHLPLRHPFPTLAYYLRRYQPVRLLLPVADHLPAAALSPEEE